MFVLIRVLVFLTIATVLFLPLNWIAIRQLRRIHPKRRVAILVLTIACNLMWPFIPLMNGGSSVVRVLRSVLGPLWFSWTCFVTLYCILLLLFWLAWIPFRRRVPFVRFAQLPSRIFLWLTIVGGVIGCYQALVPLRVENVRIEIAGLPPNLEGKRFVLLGDLHVGLLTRTSRIERIFSVARDLRPDAILIAGDFIDDDPHFVPKLLGALQVVPREPPIFAVLGNHEMYGNPSAVIDSLRGSRIRLLVNEGVDVGGVWIAGVSDFAATQMAKQLEPDLGRALRGMPAGSVPVVLAHQPRVFAEVTRRKLPLALVAHTHGGQFGIRPLGWSLAGVFLPYDMGHYRKGSSQLYVNTGTGHWLVPFRLGMTPEITLVELRGGG
jgi:uncharacterized protein